MKFLCAAFFMLCCTQFLQAQDDGDYSYVDNKILQIPKNKTYSTDSIAQYVLSNFSTDREKIRAVYTWITGNIRYSKDSMYYKGWGSDREIKMADVLRRRKGVCENYAELFSNIISKCDIKTFMVSGYSKIAGSINYTAHAWNAVQADKEWLLCDPTWDEGFKMTPHYFLVSPSQFINTHMPYDPLWQLSEHPVTHKEFRQGTEHSKKDTATFYVNDSLESFLHADTLQQLEAASRRIKISSRDNESVQTWYAYNQMKLAIIYQEEDMNNYNAAVADRNQARSLFNEFVTYRNNEFKPAKPDAEIQSAFQSIDSLINAANQKIVLIGKKTENYQYDVEGLKESLERLAGRLRSEKITFKTGSK